MTLSTRAMLCPVCKTDFNPADSDAKPFCGERCRTIDLGRWLGEDYSLPDSPVDDSYELDDPSAN